MLEGEERHGGKGDNNKQTNIGADIKKKSSGANIFEIVQRVAEVCE